MESMELCHRKGRLMGRCLIVANQTLGGTALDAAVEDCIKRAVRRFYVLVPMTRVAHEATAWTGGFALAEYPSHEVARAVMDEAERRHEAEVAEARERARLRLEQMIDKIRSAGGRAEGEVGDDDPVEATRAVLERQGTFDEIIVSTLPAGLSRWVKMDVPHRIARLTDLPATTIEAAEG